METLPPNRIVDYDHLSTSRARLLFALGIVLPPLTTFFVGVRLYSRHIRGGRYGMDDWLLVAALVFYYTLTAILFVMVYLAWFGHHTMNVSDPITALQRSVQAGFYGNLAYALVAACVRCSTGVLFIRIFIQKAYRYTAFANLALNISLGIYSVLISIFQCTPVKKLFDSTIAGHCLNQKEILLSLTIWGVICDAITWALPVPMVWQLHAPLSTRVGLTAILALGLVAVAIGGIRVWTVATISFEDPLWDLPLATYWAYTETGIGIICASAAAIAPAFERFLISPSKRIYQSLQSWASSRSDIGNSRASNESSSWSTTKSEWAMHSGHPGSRKVSIQALHDSHTADAHREEVSMRTDISVVREG